MYIQHSPPRRIAFGLTGAGRLLVVVLTLAAAVLVPRLARSFELTDPNSWPFLPVPEISTDPNGGTTYGLLAVLLQQAANGDLRSMWAPDFTNNATLGPGGTFRYFSYPSADTHWFVRAGAQEHKARDANLYYSTGRQREKWWSFEGELLAEQDPSERFFGIGNETSSLAETNYATKQVFFRGSFSLNVSENVQISWMTRPRIVRITTGAFDSLPYTGNSFPDLKGLDGGSEFFNELVADYDNRDSVDLPTTGGIYSIFAGLADRRLGSSISYTRFGTELRHCFPFGNRVVLATHALLEYSPAGNELPFWSLARLGGQHSDFFVDRSTQRGFGTARFTDNNIEGFNAELRTRVFSATVFQTRGTLELAPFFDVGKVSHDFTANPVNQLHPAGGMGFRAIADPFVVGHVDVGYGGHGVSTFAGIDYPF
ncbi:MAG TPA: BamA/TamA family outer membrane protein [Candidatus Acidoferrales bacterium]|nr:BamA/TamA family outer membrane protein [Candidatus Acidoferrales bacterium]